MCEFRKHRCYLWRGRLLIPNLLFYTYSSLLCISTQVSNLSKHKYSYDFLLKFIFSHILISLHSSSLLQGAHNPLWLSIIARFISLVLLDWIIVWEWAWDICGTHNIYLQIQLWEGKASEFYLTHTKKISYSTYLTSRRWCDKCVSSIIFFNRYSGSLCLGGGNASIGKDQFDFDSVDIFDDFGV